MKNAQQQRLNQLSAGQTAGNLQNAANTNQVQAGQVAGNAATQNARNQIDTGTGNLNLGQQYQQSGLADVNALSTLGSQQQQIAQNRELFPLDVAAKQAAVLSGAQIPLSTTQTMTASPLSTIAGLGSVAGGLFGKQVIGYDANKNPIYGPSYFDQFTNQFKQAPASTSIPPNPDTTLPINDYFPNPQPSTPLVDQSQSEVIDPNYDYSYPG